MTQEQEPAAVKCYTKQGLAKLYEVHPATFARWLIPFLDRIGEPHNGSRIYTPHQVRTIFECLGEP